MLVVVNWIEDLEYIDLEATIVAVMNAVDHGHDHVRARAEFVLRLAAVLVHGNEDK